MFIFLLISIFWFCPCGCLKPPKTFKILIKKIRPVYWLQKVVPGFMLVFVTEQLERFFADSVYWGYNASVVFHSQCFILKSFQMTRYWYCVNSALCHTYELKSLQFCLHFYQPKPWKSQFIVSTVGHILLVPSSFLTSGKNGNICLIKCSVQLG